MWRVLTDYESLPQFLPNLASSEIVQPSRGVQLVPGVVRLRQVAQKAFPYMSMRAEVSSLPMRSIASCWRLPGNVREAMHAASSRRQHSVAGGTHLCCQQLCLNRGAFESQQRHGGGSGARGWGSGGEDRYCFTAFEVLSAKVVTRDLNLSTPKAQLSRNCAKPESY